MDVWYELVSVLLLSALKFFAGPILAKSFGYTYLQTILISTIGGVGGVLLFFNLGSRIDQFFPNYFKPVNKNRKIFTKKNKFYIVLIRDYGLFGIAIFSPILISIPVGSFLSARFFEKNSYTAMAVMSLSVLFWSVSISTFIFLF
tara:strand:- start:274 stop:708 length:435 start_codon:yes stop_codon:yes gene_type:complete